MSEKTTFTGELISALTNSTADDDISDYYNVTRHPETMVQFVPATDATGTVLIEASVDAVNWVTVGTVGNIGGGAVSFVKLGWYPWLRAKRTAGETSISVLFRVAPRQKS